jgi:hypothetical protein
MVARSARRVRDRRLAHRSSGWRPRGSERPRARSPRRSHGAACAGASRGRPRRAPRGERVAEGGRARVAVAREPVLEQLGQALGARQRRDEVEVERLARDGGGLGRGAARLGQLRGADDDRVADGVGDRDLAPTVELEALRARPQRGADDQRRGELLDEERGALRRVVDRSHERRRGRGFEGVREQLGDVGGLQRPQREVLEPPGPAQLVAQPSDAVVARQAVGAIGGDDEHGEVGERLAHRGEQLEGRLV